MIVVEPVAVNDGNFTSSTIAEPDISQGEVEWVKRGSSIITSHQLHRFDFDEDNRKFYGAEATGDVVYIYDEAFNYNGDNFSTASETSDITGLAICNEHVYVLSGNNYRIYEYTLDGVYTSVNFTPGNSNGRFPRALGTDGYQLVTAYSPGAGGETIKFKNFDGSSKYPFGMDLGANTTISGIEASSRGLYLLDTDTSSGSKRILDVDATTPTDSGMVITPTNPTPLNDFVAFGDVFYSGDSVARVNQMLSNGDPALGHPGGARVILSAKSRKYESVSLNNESPAIGVAKTPPTWVKVGPTNKYAPFDGAIRTQSIANNSIIEEITPGHIIGGLAVINMTSVSSVQIEMTDPIDGVVYDRTVTTENNSEINNWFNYLWTGFDFKTEFVVLDLPPYINATTKITLTGNGEIGVGAVVLGPIFRLGVSNHGTNVRQLDFNLYSEDQFGNLDVTPRPYAKLVNFKNTVDRGLLPYVYGKLEQLRGVNAVWVGDETDENDLTLVYGPHRDNTLNIDSPTACTVPIQIRGLT